MDSVYQWKAAQYDGKFGFVSEFGKGVVELLHPEPGEKILDLGCGTGDLADEIAKAGADVTGLDASPEMIERARKKYPGIRFHLARAENFSFDEPFDAVFSNAALHWMRSPEPVLDSIWNALRVGGRFVAEFGGRGNVSSVLKAIEAVFSEDYGIDASERNPWFFPSIGEYAALLERQGFRVACAFHFDRPTPLQDGENGLIQWLIGFAESFFKGFGEEEKNKAIGKIAEKARVDLYRNGIWHVDYKRLRIMAVKERG